LCVTDPKRSATLTIKQNSKFTTPWPTREVVHIIVPQNTTNVQIVEF